MIVRGLEYKRHNVEDLGPLWGEQNASVDREVNEAFHAGTLRVYLTPGSNVQFIVLDGGKNEAGVAKSVVAGDGL